MSVDGRVRADDPAAVASGHVRWPVRSGMLPALTEGFVARPESARGLGQVLAPGAAVALTAARSARTAVHPGAPDWAGSVGKTQLAAYFAETLWQEREIELLVWVNAASRVSILSAYAAAASAALGVDPAGDAEAVAARFVSWLDETSRAWLVVLDDLSAAQDVEGLWPAGPSGRTLVTTSETPASLGRDHLQSFPMSGLSRREALSYLLGRLTEDRGQRTGAIDLVDILGGEPLALGQASAVLDSSILSCRDYLEQYLRKREQLAPSFPGRPAATAITWTLCVEHAARLLPKAPVQPMLILAATLDGHCIPGTVFTTTAARDFAGGAAAGLTKPEDAWACITSLARAGLLTAEQATGSTAAGPAPPVIRMHQELQAAVRSASSREMLERAALAAADALLEAWPAADAGSWLADSLRSAAASIMRLAGDRLWAGNGYRILFRTGQSLEDAHLTMLAAAHWNHIAAASDRFLGAEHADSLAASDHLAESFLAAGRGLEALPWFRRVLSNRVSVLGPDHPATTGFEMRLGRALLAAGGAEEAITIFERLLAERRQAGGASQPDALEAGDALADAYCAAGRLREGIRQRQQVLADRERGLGRSHPATLATCQKLADAYLAADRVKEALAAYKRVASGRDRALGHDHPDTIDARASLALANQSAGRMAAAIQLLEQSRTDSERVLGPDHLDTLTRRINLAHAYYAVGRIGDAAVLLRDAAERCDRVLPSDDPLAQTVRESLANIGGG